MTSTNHISDYLQHTLYKTYTKSRKDVNKNDDYAVKYILYRRRCVGCRGESVGGCDYVKHHTHNTIHILYAFRYTKPIVSSARNSCFITQNTVCHTLYNLAIQNLYNTIHTSHHPPRIPVNSLLYRLIQYK